MYSQLLHSVNTPQVQTIWNMTTTGFTDPNTVCI